MDDELTHRKTEPKYPEST